MWEWAVYVIRNIRAKVAHQPFLLFLWDDVGLCYSESPGSYYEMGTLVSHKLTLNDVISYFFPLLPFFFFSFSFFSQSLCAHMSLCVFPCYTPMCAFTRL